ncbi:MAG: hypothetical protein KAV87_29485, partial [Desulfobacteraceae bacterium]|nr:hypothetical protein [Desulfobacteraceae bacterium]
ITGGAYTGKYQMKSCAKKYVPCHPQLAKPVPLCPPWLQWFAAFRYHSLNMRTAEGLLHAKNRLVSRRFIDSIE